MDTAFGLSEAATPSSGMMVNDKPRYAKVNFLLQETCVRQVPECTTGIRLLLLIIEYEGSHKCGCADDGKLPLDTRLVK